MDNSEETILAKPSPPIVVRVESGLSTGCEMRFTESFQIGREKDCGLQLKDPHVSRRHLEILYDGLDWIIRDLGSSNGVYLDGAKIKEATLPECAKVELGLGGPILSVVQELPKTGLAPPQDAEFPKGDSVTQVVSRYFDKSPSVDAGNHTLMVRQAFERVRKKQSKNYLAIIGVIAVLLLGVGGKAWFQQKKIGNLEAIAGEIFYAMKAIEVQMGQVESIVLSSANPAQKKAMIEKRKEFDEMTRRYNDYISELGIYNDNSFSQEERIIMRVARIFGECELNMPDGFLAEVQKYIGKWRTTPRLDRAIQRANEEGYPGFIRQAFLDKQLPPQFFYLALQESDFKSQIVGPRTRFGIAKGVWQFIPDTGFQYGLRSGPLLEEPRYDPNDERFDFEKATEAAARYIKDIYNGEAQASGLLVMASYNWGHNRVRRLIRGMPENPRDRNFWQLLKHYKIPKETYDYVFYIFSAAVIGEDPKLFGFDFDDPLT